MLALQGVAMKNASELAAGSGVGRRNVLEQDSRSDEYERKLVARRHLLSDLSALVPGQRWRRGRRPHRHPAPAALSADARRRRDLAVADLRLADGRFRLRHLRLHRYRSAVRDDGGFRRAGESRAW